MVDSVAAGRSLPWADYIAVQDLRDSTLAHCPDCHKVPCECEEADYGSTSSPDTHPSPAPSASTSSKRRKISHDGTSMVDLSSTSQIEIPSHLLPPNPPLPTDLERLTYKSRYACQRASPLVCPNQDLALELDVIRRSRALEGEQQSALSYARAISSIKGEHERGAADTRRPIAVNWVRLSVPTSNQGGLASAKASIYRYQDCRPGGFLRPSAAM